MTTRLASTIFDWPSVVFSPMLPEQWSTIAKSVRRGVRAAKLAAAVHRGEHGIRRVCFLEFGDLHRIKREVRRRGVQPSENRRLVETEIENLSTS